LDYKESMGSVNLTCISQGACDAVEKLIAKLPDSGQIIRLKTEESLAKPFQPLGPSRRRWCPEHIGNPLAERLVGLCLDANSDALIGAFSYTNQVGVPWLSPDVVESDLVLRDGLNDDGSGGVGVGAEQFLKLNRYGWARGSAAPGLSELLSAPAIEPMTFTACRSGKAKPILDRVDTFYDSH